MGSDGIGLDKEGSFIGTLVSLGLNFKAYNGCPGWLFAF